MKILKRDNHKKTMIRLAALGDQVLFSGANFILTIILARFYSEVELAAYGIAITIALMISSIQQNTYVIQNAVLPPVIMRRRGAKVFGEQLIAWGLVFLIEVLCLGTICAIGDNSLYFKAIAVSTISCTLLYMQISLDRVLLIKHERFVDPLVTSALFLILIGGLFFAVPHYGLGFNFTMLLIGIFTVFKNIWIGCVIGKPDFFWGWRLLMRDSRRYFISASMGVAGSAGFINIPVFVLGYLSTPIQTAVFGAMRSLMQPVMVILRSLDVIDKNYFQQKGSSYAVMHKAVLKLLVIYGSLALSALLVMAIFSRLIVHLAYGEKYIEYSNLLAGWGAIFFFIAISNPIETVLVKLKRFKIYNYYRIPAGLLGICLSISLSGSMGAWGAVIACIAGWTVSVSVGLWLIRDVLFFKMGERG